jgi:hypothetical protein
MFIAIIHIILFHILNDYSMYCFNLTISLFMLFIIRRLLIYQNRLLIFSLLYVCFRMLGIIVCWRVVLLWIRVSRFICFFGIVRITVFDAVYVNCFCVIFFIIIFIVVYSGFFIVIFLCLCNRILCVIGHFVKLKSNPYISYVKIIVHYLNF